MKRMELRKRTDRKGWWARFKDPSTGKWTGWRKMGNTRREAQIRAAGIESKIALVDVGAMTPNEFQASEHMARPINDVLDEWKSHLKHKGTSASRRAIIQRTAERIIGDCRFTALADIKPGKVMKWLDTNGNTARTRHDYLQVIKQFTKWAKQSGMLTEDPIGHLSTQSSKPSRQGRALTPDETVVLLNHVHERNARRWLFYLFAFRAGLRWTEIGKLRWEQIDLDAGWIVLHAPDTKSKRGDEVPISTELVNALRSFPAQTGRIFNSTPTLKTFKRDCERAGIKGTVYRKSARRSFGTHLAMQGTDIRKTQRLMRHTDPKLTSNLYTDPMLLDLREEVNRLGHAGVTKSDEKPSTTFNNLLSDEKVKVG